MPENDKELKMLAKAAEEFAKKELAPMVGESDQQPDPALMAELAHKAFDLDFFHILLPEELDGMGLGAQALGALLEPICQVDSSFGALLFSTILAYEVMHTAGGQDQLKVIVGAADGPAPFLVAFPIYDHPAELEHQLRAEKRGEGHALHGRATYLVPGGLASRALVPALVEGQRGSSYFLVDLAAPGVRISDPVLALGLHACPGVDAIMEGVAAIRIGEEGKGAAYFEQVGDRLQTAVAAMALGLMKGAFKEGLNYASGREQGGRKTTGWSEIQTIFADFALKIKMAEMALRQAAQAVDRRVKGWQEAALAAAIQVSAMACETTTDGIQVMGGVGYMKDFGQEKRFRDARHIQALLGMTNLKKLRFIRQNLK